MGRLTLRSGYVASHRTSELEEAVEPNLSKPLTSQTRKQIEGVRDSPGHTGLRELESPVSFRWWLRMVGHGRSAPRGSGG